MTDLTRIIAQKTAEYRTAYLSDDFVSGLRVWDGREHYEIFHKILWDYLPDSDPQISRLLAKEIARVARSFKAEIILGIESSGIHLASLACQFCDCNFGFIRKSSKAYGLKRRIEGHFKNRRNVLLVDNYDFTGGTLVEAANFITSAGYRLVQALAVDSFDRLPKSPARLNLPFVSLLKNSEKIGLLVKSDYFPQSLRPFIREYVDHPSVFFDNTAVYRKYLDVFYDLANQNHPLLITRTIKPPQKITALLAKKIFPSRK